MIAFYMNRYFRKYYIISGILLIPIVTESLIALINNFGGGLQIGFVSDDVMWTKLNNYYVYCGLLQRVKT